MYLRSERDNQTAADPRTYLANAYGGGERSAFQSNMLDVKGSTRSMVWQRKGGYRCGPGCTWLASQARLGTFRRAIRIPRNRAPPIWHASVYGPRSAVKRMNTSAALRYLRPQKRICQVHRSSGIEISIRLKPPENGNIRECPESFSPGCSGNWRSGDKDAQELPAIQNQPYLPLPKEQPSLVGPFTSVLCQ